MSDDLDADELAGGTDEWETEGEFLEWLDEFCEFAIFDYEHSTEKYPDSTLLQKAQKARGIQNDLKSGEISFEEALERYDCELRTGTDRSGGNDV